MKKKQIDIYLITIINAFIMFFGYLITNLFYLQFFQIIIMFLFFKFKKIKIEKNDKLIFIILIYLSFSLLFSHSPIDSLKVILIFLLAEIQKILLCNLTKDNSSWRKLILNFITLFAFVHVFMTFLQYISPDLITKLNLYLLSGENLENNLMFLKIKNYAGITGQTGVNAFYICTFILMISIKLKKTEKVNRKLIYYVLTAFGFIALILTAKRMFLVIAIILFTLSIVDFKNINIKKFISDSSIFILFGILFLFILKNSGLMNIITEKNNQLFLSGDIFNGRSKLWFETLKIFKDYPLFGCGLNSLYILLGEYTHNIYIQLLAETGLIGFSLFIFCFVFNLKNSNKLEEYGKIGFLLQLLFLFYGLSGNPLYSQIFVLFYYLGLAFSGKYGD